MGQELFWTRRRLLARAGALGIAVAGVAGCGSSGGKGSGGTGTAAKPSDYKVPASLVSEAKKVSNRSVTVLSQKEYDENANTALNESLQAFAEQTGTKVDNSFASADTGDLVAKTDQSVKAHNIRDLAFFQSDRFVAQFHELNDLTDVSDVVAELEQTYGPAASVGKSNCVYDGKWWGIPYFSVGAGTFIRKDWLEDKGIQLGELKTYENARDIALEISDPGKKRYGWGMTINRSGDGNGLVEGLVNCYGGAITSNDGQKVIFNSPETMDAITFLTEIFTSDKYAKMLPPGIESWTDNSNNENWLAGVIGMTLNQFSVYAQSKSTNNPVYHNTLALAGFSGPATDRPLQTGSIQALLIFKGAKNPDLAKVVAKYLVAGDALYNVAKGSVGLVMPAYEKVWQSKDFYLHGDPAFKMLHDVLYQELPIKTKSGLRFPQDPSAGRNAVLQSYVLTDMMQQILQKHVSVRQAVADAHDRMVKIFVQAGIPQ